MTSTPTEVLAGLVERVTFHNEENGFCVLCPAAEVLVRPTNPRTRAFLSRFHGTTAAVRAAG